MQPTVSIIILNWNNLKLTRDCITSIEKNTAYPNYEVIIFDNASTEPGTEDYYASISHKVIRSSNNLGFAKGNNEAAKVAKGELLVFLNNDTVVQQNWLDAMVRSFKQCPECGIVGSKLLYPDGTIQHAGVFLDYNGNHINFFKGLPSDIEETIVTREREAVIGASMLIPKDIFIEVGGFCEEYVMGYEDIDLCFKVKQRGLKILFCASSVVIHYAGISLKQKGNVFKKKTDKRNKKIFDKKWSEHLYKFRLPHDLTALKPYHYRRHNNLDLLELVPSDCQFVLDADCGMGELGGILKEARENVVVWGLESNLILAREAEKKLDKVLIGDVETNPDLFNSSERFDCILLPSVLEHVVDPWNVLRSLREKVSSGGCVICSFSNLNNYNTMLKIMFNRWIYRMEGRIDLWQVRCFTLRAITSLFVNAGYEIIQMRKKNKHGIINNTITSKLLDKIGLADIIEYQVVARTQVK